MKQLLVILMAISLFIIIGCGKKDTPLEDAVEYVNKSLSFDENITLDASKLNYKVEEEVDGKTTVTVSGKIRCDGKIVFVRQDDQWILSE
jgi:major membrane immunogen (membrane-anchored lipoprotein)